MDFHSLVAAQRRYFETGVTLDPAFRMEQLHRLGLLAAAREGTLLAALREDLGKSAFEGYMTELGMVRQELGEAMRVVGKCSRPSRRRMPLAQFPSTGWVAPEPYGVALIMAPWNYPVQLTLSPLIAALAAGNCAVVKPSAYAPATSAVIRRILRACFPEEYIFVVEGGRAENQALLDQRFDYIFFTGGVTVGKEVMAKAAKHLTPVTLELGGKSPCVVDRTAKLELAAKRIAFGKLLNCGQTCVAPDYILVERSVKDEFLVYLKKWIVRMYGADATENDAYVKMINQKHFDRVTGLIDPEKVVFGGGWNERTMQIQPTILDDVKAEDAVMQEEIFGPIFPILPVDSMAEAEEFICKREKPLALYLFTQNKALAERFLRYVPFGGGCINDTIIHLATSRMGFGGVGGSGMGSYHGKKSFETFSHEKSIVNKHTWMDLPVRYAPYHRIQRLLLRLFLR